MRYPCEECDYKAISKSYLKVHIESVHKKVNNLNDILMIGCLFVCLKEKFWRVSSWLVKLNGYLNLFGRNPLTFFLSINLIWNSYQSHFQLCLIRKLFSILHYSYRNLHAIFNQRNAFTKRLRPLKRKVHKKIVDILLR